MRRTTKMMMSSWLPMDWDRQRRLLVSARLVDLYVLQKRYEWTHISTQCCFHAYILGSFVNSSLWDAIRIVNDCRGCCAKPEVSTTQQYYAIVISKHLIFKTHLSTSNQFTRFYYAIALSQHLILNSFIDIKPVHPFLLLQCVIPAPYRKLIYRHEINCRSCARDEALGDVYHCFARENAGVFAPCWLSTAQVEGSENEESK